MDYQAICRQNVGYITLLKVTLHEILDFSNLNLRYPKLQNNKTKSIEGNGAGRKEAYFWSKRSDQIFVFNQRNR